MTETRSRRRPLAAAFAVAACQFSAARPRAQSLEPRAYSPNRTWECDWRHDGLPVYLFSTGPGGYTCDVVYFSCSSNDTGHVIQQADFRLGVILRF